MQHDDGSHQSLVDEGTSGVTPVVLSYSRGFKLDDGWPQSETCDCPALSKKIYRKRERESGREGVPVSMCRCDFDL